MSENSCIEQSLCFLKQMMLALAEGRSDRHYRQSKLTQLLKGTVGRNCITIFIANILGSAQHHKETLSTLRFASLIMNVPVQPAIVELKDPKVVINDLRNEISNLKQELKMRDMLAAIHSGAQHMTVKPEMTNIGKKISCILQGDAVNTKVEQDGQTLSPGANASRHATARSSKHISEVIGQVKKMSNKLDEKLQKKVKQKNSRLHQGHSKISQATEVEEKIVGELDFKNFAVGTAQKQGDITNLQMATRRQMKLKPSARSEEAKAFGTHMLPSSEQMPMEGVSVECESADDAPDANARPSTTPPEPAQAFEDFKDEYGTEITTILKENRATLLQRHRKAKELVITVNSLKQQIDYTTSLWDEKKRQRKDQGEMVAPSGQPVIDEPELGLMLTLADLKGRYRAMHKKLLGTQAEVHYCQDMINKCRQHLLSEFTSWYQKSFLTRQDATGSEERLRAFASSLPDLKKISAKNEERGKFEQQQHVGVLVGELEESVFYKSKASAERQLNYSKALTQHSPRLKNKTVLASGLVQNKMTQHKSSQ
uniref:Kinesin motor domain-containing protein n=1 Tax=Eptatretus burgeri TaxID=7764 RepID=A0A8C4R3W6_EPTBU